MVVSQRIRYVKVQHRRMLGHARDEEAIERYNHHRILDKYPGLSINHIRDSMFAASFIVFHV